jgi:hypothetical protein
MCAAIQAAEQFLPFTHLFLLPPTAVAFARAILLSEGNLPDAKSNSGKSIYLALS